LLQEPSEKNLVQALTAQEKIVSELLKTNQYTQALQSLAVLAAPIDQFFLDVMVMTDDLPLRTARLTLLTKLRTLFLQIADISLL
jgi:glycyl-tRNA synthetase beta chain